MTGIENEAKLKVTNSFSENGSTYLFPCKYFFASNNSNQYYSHGDAKKKKKTSITTGWTAMPFGSGIKRQGAGRETTVRNLRSPGGNPWTIVVANKLRETLSTSFESDIMRQIRIIYMLFLTSNLSFMFLHLK
jgi:hypothetical protein